MIKDFITAYVKTYKEINANKIKAKNFIKTAKRLKKNWKRYQSDVRITLSYLKDIYSILPQKSRIGCVQETIDLLQYGKGIPNNEYNEGIVKNIQTIIDLLDRFIENSKSDYSKGNYENIMNSYEHYSDIIERKLNYWDVK